MQEEAGCVEPAGEQKQNTTEAQAVNEQKASADFERFEPQESISQVEEEDEEAVKEEESDLETRRAQLDENGQTALVEAVLFLESESQTVETLSKITKLEPQVITDSLDRLKEKYSNEDSGIELVQKFGGWMLAPKWESFDFVKERYGKRNDSRLSKAAIETLAIIAYSQPITRAEIESIRHVSVDNMMRILLERKLIKKNGEKDVPGRPSTYGTTKEFLEFFHLQSISELPQLAEEEQKRFELAR